MIYGIKVNNLIGSPLLGGVVYAQIIKLYMDFFKYKPKYIFYSIFNFDLLFILNPLNANYIFYGTDNSDGTDLQDLILVTKTNGQIHTYKHE